MFFPPLAGLKGSGGIPRGRGSLESHPPFPSSPGEGGAADLKAWLEESWLGSGKAK